MGLKFEETIKALLFEGYNIAKQHCMHGALIFKIVTLFLYILSFATVKIAKAMTFPRALSNQNPED